MADTQTRPAKVATDHEAAKAAIGSLRDVAVTLGELGDQVLDLEATERHLSEQVQYVEQLERDGTEDAAQLRQAIADFDRGIINQAELVRLGREV